MNEGDVIFEEDFFDISVAKIQGRQEKGFGQTLYQRENKIQQQIESQMGKVDNMTHDIQQTVAKQRTFKMKLDTLMSETQIDTLDNHGSNSSKEKFETINNYLAKLVANHFGMMEIMADIQKGMVLQGQDDLEAVMKKLLKTKYKVQQLQYHMKRLKVENHIIGIQSSLRWLSMENVINKTTHVNKTNVMLEQFINTTDHENRTKVQNKSIRREYFQQLNEMKNAMKIIHNHTTVIKKNESSDPNKNQLNMSVRKQIEDQSDQILKTLNNCTSTANIMNELMSKPEQNKLDLTAMNNIERLKKAVEGQRKRKTQIVKTMQIIKAAKPRDIKDMETPDPKHIPIEGRQLHYFLLKSKLKGSTDKEKELIMQMYKEDLTTKDYTELTKELEQSRQGITQNVSIYLVADDLYKMAGKAKRRYQRTLEEYLKHNLATLNTRLLTNQIRNMDGTKYSIRCSQPDQYPAVREAVNSTIKKFNGMVNGLYVTKHCPTMKLKRIKKRQTQLQKMKSDNDIRSALRRIALAK